MIKSTDLLKWNSVGHMNSLDIEPAGQVINVGAKRAKIDQDTTTGAYRIVHIPEGVPGGTENFFPDLK